MGDASRPTRRLSRPTRMLCPRAGRARIGRRRHRPWAEDDLPGDAVADDDRAGDAALAQAVRAARAHADAATQIARFLDQMGAVPDAASIAECANLLAREELTRDDRASALRAAGLEVPSLDPEAA